MERNVKRDLGGRAGRRKGGRKLLLNDLMEKR